MLKFAALSEEVLNQKAESFLWMLTSAPAKLNLQPSSTKQLARPSWLLGKSEKLAFDADGFLAALSFTTRSFSFKRD